MSENIIVVLGAGSWGSALAILLAKNGNNVRLWGRDANKIAAMQQQSCNPYFLPDIPFPKNITLFSDLSQCLNGVNDILIAVPSHAFQSTLVACKPYLKSSCQIISATKGLEPQSSCLLHKVVAEELGAAASFAILSGPSFAKEVARGLPTAICLASDNESLLDSMVARLHNNSFRVYKSHDVIGVQIGGVVKNVLAIAAGIADGLKFGANARAALITRGLAEMCRLGDAMGGQAQTFTGLAGLGDLVLTCTDDQSRNRRFGLALGQGKEIAAAEQEIGQVVEGKSNAGEVFRLAEQQQVDMPIVEQVYNIIFHGKPPQQAVMTLMSRALKFE